MTTFKPAYQLLIWLFLCLSWPVAAQEFDEQRINELVQQEVQRLLSPEVLDAAIEQGIIDFIAKQRKAEQRARDQALGNKVKNLRPVDVERDHIFGDLDAPITLVEYSDFECPFCKRFHPTVVQLMQDNPAKIRWIYRHYPLGFHNPGAQKQAEASECVAEIAGNDAFWKFSDLIYQRTTSNGNGFPIDKLQPLAVEIGVDGESFNECLQSQRMASRVQQDIDNGVAIGVSGTPAAVLMNAKGELRMVVGAQPLIELQRVVDELSNGG